MPAMMAEADWNALKHHWSGDQFNKAVILFKDIIKYLICLVAISGPVPVNFKIVLTT